jgi:hypothetical protein
MNQANRLNIIRKWASQMGHRLFRNNVGKGYQGKITEINHHGRNRKVIDDLRYIDFGLTVGSSDLIGWQSKKITKDMIGKSIAVFFAVEEKSPRDRLSDEQINFLQSVHANGGIAMVAKTKADGTFELINIEDLG